MFERLPTGSNFTMIDWDYGHCDDCVERWLKDNGFEYERLNIGWGSMFKITSGEYAGYYDTFSDAGNRRIRLLQDIG